MITQRLALNVDHESVTPRLQMVQNDSGRGIEFTISDYVIPDGASAVVYFETPSTGNGAMILANGTVTGQSISCAVPAIALSDVGTDHCQLQLSKDGSVIKSFIFEIDVTRDLPSGRSLSSSDISQLDQVIATLQDQLAEIEATMATNPKYIGQLEVNQSSTSAPGPKSVIDHDGISFLDSSGNLILNFPDPVHPYVQYKGKSSVSGISDFNNFTETGIWYLDNDPSNNPIAHAPATYQYAFLVVLMTTEAGSDVLQQFVIRPARRANNAASGYIYARERYYSGGYQWNAWVDLLDKDVKNYHGFHLNKVGWYEDTNYNDISLANNTYAAPGVITAYSGDYLVFVSVSFATNASGIRWIGISENSNADDTVIGALFSTWCQALSGKPTKVMLSGFMKVQDTGVGPKQLRLKVFQDSGSDLNISAIRIRLVSLGNNTDLDF